MTRTCGECRFSSWPFQYQHDDKPDALPLGYKCQRHPPIATGGMMSAAWTMWPRVLENDWCGEFKPREKKDE